MRSYPYDEYSDKPLDWQATRPPAPLSNYEDAIRHANRELARAKSLVVPAFVAAAQPPEKIAAVEAWYDQQLAARAAWLGEEIPVPERRGV